MIVAGGISGPDLLDNRAPILYCRVPPRKWLFFLAYLLDTNEPLCYIRAVFHWYFCIQAVLCI